MYRAIRLIVAVAAPLTPNVPPGMLVEGAGQTRYLYVADIGGTWLATTGTTPVVLKRLARVSSDAHLELRTEDGDFQSERYFIVLRNPRTLGKREVRCSTTQPCSKGAVAIAQLPPEKRAGIAVAPQVGVLYDDLGRREEIHERIRLVGARGTERDIGITVLPRTGRSVDLSELLARIGQPPERLVARFCSLTEVGPDSAECIESRRRLPGDCELTSATCEVAGENDQAFRVDVYVRERAMLGSVAQASGFAAIVRASGRAPAVARRDSLAKMLEPLGSVLADDELRGLTAAAAFTVAQAAR